MCSSGWCGYGVCVVYHCVCLCVDVREWVVCMSVGMWCV